MPWPGECEGWGGPSSISRRDLAQLVVGIFPPGLVPQTSEDIRVTAYAVGSAESGRNPKACGDELLSIGLWQIYTPTGERAGFTRDQLFLPHNNALAALTISSGGTNWNAWCTWEETACAGGGTGSYRNFLVEARQEIAALGVVLPPIPVPLPANGVAFPVILGGLLMYSAGAIIARARKGGL